MRLDDLNLYILISRIIIGFEKLNLQNSWNCKIYCVGRKMKDVEWLLPSYFIFLFWINSTVANIFARKLHLALEEIWLCHGKNLLNLVHLFLICCCSFPIAVLSEKNIKSWIYIRTFNLFEDFSFRDIRRGWDIRSQKHNVNLCTKECLCRWNCGLNTYFNIILQKNL